MLTIIVTHEQAGMRLDLFIAGLEPALSRATVQKIIKAGASTINGRTSTPHRALKEGDKIKYERQTKDEKPRASYQHAHSFEPTTCSATSLSVIHETSSWLVINKPAGLLVHPDVKTKQGTLVELLIAHAPEIARIGADPERPGIVHRLDREVSGLMVVAKTQDAFDSLRHQFAARTIKKTYLALVHGRVSHDEGDIKLPIGRSATKPRMAAKTDKSGRAAWTHYHVIERFVGATLIETEILSGRTHQIRAHLHAIGHPVIGDNLYKLRKTDRNVQAPRIMLQSIALDFNDPVTNERKSFHLKPDPAFDAVIKQLR